MTGQPNALLGVAPPSPFIELSELWAIRVLDVWRHDRPGDGARPWDVLLAAEPRWFLPVTSTELRSPTRLNELMQAWGRNPELPPLTKTDGRRALRLMHEHIESKSEHDNIEKEQDR